MTVSSRHQCYKFQQTTKDIIIRPYFFIYLHFTSTEIEYYDLFDFLSQNFLSQNFSGNHFSLRFMLPIQTLIIMSRKYFFRFFGLESVPTIYILKGCRRFKRKCANLLYHVVTPTAVSLYRPDDTGGSRALVRGGSYNV